MTAAMMCNERVQQSYQVKYGNQTFEYQLYYVPPKNNKHRVQIHVHPNGLVQVDAPEETTLSDVKAAVQKRARWVIKHLKEIEERQRHALPREYVSGESLFYLGRRYVLKRTVLKRTEGVNAKPSVRLYRGQIQVVGSELSKDQVKSLIKEWYREKAKIVFERRFELLVSNISWLKEKPQWKLREMKRQWGSCSPSGTLLLNPHLVKAPTACIDYVLLHELCHLKEHNHSPKFYGFLSREMPQWAVVKTKLDGMAELLLNE